MKIACLQMNTIIGNPEVNFAKAERMIHDAAKDSPDVIVLPETWNSGFFPKDNLAAHYCHDGAEVMERIGALAKYYHINIVAGSVSDLRGTRIYNTAYIFDRDGNRIADYDKTHLFTPMGEDKYYTSGDHLCRFRLDGVECALVICYDLRFPELARRLALDGTGILFAVSQWPGERVFHLRSLTTARAIENQLYVVNCNSCGLSGGTVFAGNSAVIDPLGKTVSLAGTDEEILLSECDAGLIDRIRSKIPVFRDRRPELY